MSDHTGSRWCKCDLHMHTTSSICYIDKTDTAEQWVGKAAAEGLEAVAVTDHNDYRGIEAIMEEGKKQGICVFPGVEITCDSSKIHILVIFDSDKSAETVRDFLNRCDIDSENIGKPDGTSLSVFEVCTIAKKRGALVIAAHIDEFSSINSMNPANLDKLLESDLLDAVQVTNLPVWRKYQADKDIDYVNRTLAEKYGPDATPAEVERWRKCYARAVEAGLPLVSFSDNPYSATSGKHGLWGIGSAYTWIQMDNVINLESIRQSLITPDSRIRMHFDSKDRPKSEPDFWIRSIDVEKTELNPHMPIHFDFHPQLNCIIGGRGSGKSSIVRVLMGVYKQLPSPLLKNIIDEETQFYTMYEDGGQGIFREDSVIRIRFSWYGFLYMLLVTDIKGVNDQKYTLYHIDPETDEMDEQPIDDLRFGALMSAQVFSEREIYDIAAVKGELLNQIDRLIPDMYILKSQKEYYVDKLLNISYELRTTERFTRIDYRVLSELNWLHSIDGSGDYTAASENYNITSMIECRNNTAELIDEAIDRVTELRALRTKYQKKLDDSIVSIRALRTDFINRTLADDANYKIELSPLSSHESFYKMLSDILKVDLSHIHDDVVKLETALFAKKGGPEKYVELLSGKAGFSEYFTHLINDLSDMDHERMLLFRPEDELCLFYHPNGVKRFFPMTNASPGAQVAALLSFFLFSGSMPLIVDQPEDQIDNHIVYVEILGKLKRAKQTRQLILVTHNANIAANADPEMIISMDSGSKFMRVRTQGTMDNVEIRHEICETIEGSEEAFLQRTRRYHIEKQL